MNPTGAGSEPQRWRRGQSGNPSGRASTRFIRRLLAEKDESGKPLREQIVRHLIELATSYTVIHAGRDLELASGRDSVEAAKLLLSYELGKPPASPDEERRSLAEFFRRVERDRIDLVISTLGEQAKTMSAAELGEYFRACSASPEDYLRLAGAFMDERARASSKLLEPVVEAAMSDSSGCAVQADGVQAGDTQAEPARGPRPDGAAIEQGGEP